MSNYMFRILHVLAFIAALATGVGLTAYTFGGDVQKMQRFACSVPENTVVVVDGDPVYELRKIREEDKDAVFGEFYDSETVKNVIANALRVRVLAGESAVRFYVEIKEGVWFLTPLTSTYRDWRSVLAVERSISDREFVQRTWTRTTWLDILTGSCCTGLVPFGIVWAVLASIPGWLKGKFAP